jgi:hypothetical protein
MPISSTHRLIIDESFVDPNFQLIAPYVTLALGGAVFLLGLVQLFGRTAHPPLQAPAP